MLSHCYCFSKVTIAFKLVFLESKNFLLWILYSATVGMVCWLEAKGEVHTELESVEEPHHGLCHS